MRLLRGLFCFIPLLWLYRAQGQALSPGPDLQFRNFSSNSGFINEYMGNVLRDKKGYVWICGSGLYRFDGKNYKRYSNHDSRPNRLRDNYVVDLLEDDQGRLWVGNGGGLCYYDHHTDGFHYIDSVGNRRIRYAYFFSILNGHLWFISDHGLCCLNLKTLKVTGPAVPGSHTVTGLFAIDSNTLLLSNRKDAYLYHIRQDSLEAKPGLKSIFQGCLIWCGDKYLLTNGEGGLLSLKSMKDEPKPVPGAAGYDISAMTMLPQCTGDSILWVSTSNAGLYTFNINTDRFGLHFTHDPDNPFSLQTNEVTQLTPGPHQTLWIATGTGISLIDFRSQGMKTRFTWGKYVRKITADKFDTTKAWISFANKGIALIDWNTQQTLNSWFSLNKNHSPAPGGTDVRDMVQLERHKWLLCQRNGLLVWDVNSGVQQHLPAPESETRLSTILRNIIRIDSDTYYITSSNGLLLYKPSAHSLEFVLPRTEMTELSSFDMHTGVSDRSKNIWIATSCGLVRYETKTGKAVSFRLALKRDTVVNAFNCASIDHSGNIICTGIGGMAIFNPKDQSFLYNNSFNDVSRVACYAAIVRDDIVWINSNIGLIHYDLKTGKSGAISAKYTPSGSVEAFGVVGDELVLHFRNAYSYFKPDNLLDKPLPSPPLIEQLLVNNIAYNPEKKNIELEHDQNVLNFSFTAFDFDDPAHITFRYRLRGLNDTWSRPTEQRTANFTGLPPGEYTFTVEAGYNGKWNETSATFRFSILPPYWQRWWFRGLILFVFTGGVISIAAFRIRRIKKREAHKTSVNKMVSELEMKVLRSQMNPHFIFNSLNSIQKFIWENKQEDASEYLTKFSRLMRSILDNSMHKFISLEQELSTVTLYVELEHRRSSNKFDYVINVDDNLDTAHTLVPPLIMQPYVENAIWHGLLHKAGRGELKINVAAEAEDLIRVTIEDNGVGRPATIEMAKHRTQKSVSYGLNLTEQRLMMTEWDGRKGKVVIEDLYDDTQQSAGTRVVIFLPVAGYTKI